MNTFVSHSANETLDIAAHIASQLHPGDVVALFGSLGAGKTTFARGLANALGVSSSVSSPTYTIQHTYKAKGASLHHIDLYRLMTPDDVDMLDIEACWESRDITIIEWPERAGDLLPPQTWRIHISMDLSPEERHIEVIPPTHHSKFINNE